MQTLKQSTALFKGRRRYQNLARLVAEKLGKKTGQKFAARPETAGNL